MDQDKPNLFAFATSELSQDTFLAWLLSWADPKYAAFDPPVHQCAVRLVRFLLGVSDDDPIQSVVVGRQWEGIDVWAEVNEAYFILIEDKKGTRDHSNQLTRYLKIAQEYAREKGISVVPIYFKMEEQGIWSGIHDSGFRILSRADMLHILKDYADDRDSTNGNQILLDYYAYLCDLDRQVNSYKTLPLDAWQWHGWQGFFSALRKEFDGEWDYVPNPSGGFLGFWWSWREGHFQGSQFEF
ncbi:PD-(D/E)XK nuclease family protein [Thiorhodococcus mannitoliphagus]|uniref:PD-(D/E)XK nuclease family protein n=1 Tax=Thiorhodococcus mannitoliphagus TaxID=329406 RepID=A0A6P1E6V1_9GAMM|nr:PD-(D/E)XK nuclease family protein [Thiorhodococcus mannitoliphagus]NEX23724.1 PD-(D/E)XK nuclease family protein [Thiorhodococcus mannitoliphagus]